MDQPRNKSEPIGKKKGQEKKQKYKVIFLA
jgi:hypothetical protein